MFHNMKKPLRPGVYLLYNFYFAFLLCVLWIVSLLTNAYHSFQGIFSETQMSPISLHEKYLRRISETGEAVEGERKEHEQELGQEE